VSTSFLAHRDRMVSRLLRVFRGATLMPDEPDKEEPAGKSEPAPSPPHSGGLFS